MNNWSLICSTFSGPINLLHFTPLFVFAESRYHFSYFAISFFISMEQMLMLTKQPSFNRFVSYMPVGQSINKPPSSHFENSTFRGQKASLQFIENCVGADSANNEKSVRPV